VYRKDQFAKLSKLELLRVDMNYHVLDEDDVEVLVFFVPVVRLF